MAAFSTCGLKTDRVLRDTPKEMALCWVDATP
ncbi:hypothetical protein JOF56_004242 [Kibdelosporangium banguiense]|uniref:Uncharacterized protein n=1 Tax=Kibdelosporangium banguiense TaxID=1365924 RepID=A0ABS4THE3_9PSEU|nr:hypothetical protein [Kibdelosporangium banguiense]